MAWAWVQGNTADGGGGTVTTEPCAYPADVAIGDLLVAVGNHGSLNQTGLSTAMSDSIGNTWFMATSTQNSTNTAAIYYAISKASGPNTVTYTPPGTSAFTRVMIDEYSGANLALDQVGVGNGNSGTAVTSPATVTLHANELLYGHISFNSGTLTIDATYTGRETVAGGDLQTADKNGVSPGSFTFGGATGVTTPWLILLATFYEAAPAVLEPAKDFASASRFGPF